MEPHLVTTSNLERNENDMVFIHPRTVKYIFVIYLCDRITSARHHSNHQKISYIINCMYFCYYNFTSISLNKLFISISNDVGPSNFNKFLNHYSLDSFPHSSLVLNEVILSVFFYSITF